MPSCRAAAGESTYPFDVLTHGGTGAGRFHLWDKGVPSLYIGFATRYVHSAASVIHRDDMRTRRGWSPPWRRSWIQRR